jgi:geranylgeranylglycerol-phosphate geranylgeranyltransferase
MRFGILQRYPNLRRLSKRMAAYSALCRPFTLLGAFLAGFSLDILFSRLQAGAPELSHSALIGLTLALLQAGGQAMNQSIEEEVAIDRLNGKTYRPTVEGRISLKNAKIASVLLYVMGILLAFRLNNLYGAFSLIITFFAVGYTMPPIRVKRHFVLNNVWQGLARGMLPAIYVSLAHPEHMKLALSYGIPLTIWTTFCQTTKDWPDTWGDDLYGIRTLPVVLGKEGAMRVILVGVILAFAVLNLFLASGLLPAPFIWVNALIIPSGLLIWGLREELRFRYGENNLSWIAFYGTLSLFYMLPALLI